MKYSVRWPTRRESLRVMRGRVVLAFFGALLLLAVGLCRNWTLRPAGELLNVGFDASRGFFHHYDRQWLAKPQAVGGTVRSVCAGSIRQTEALIGGLVADTVCLSSSYELDHLAAAGLVAVDWRGHFPSGSSPFSTTIVLLVRAGNPKALRDWPDLLRSDVRLALPDPRVSGAGRHAYLALYAGSEGSGLEWGSLRAALLRAELIPLGASLASEFFRNSSRADVLLTWESEALRVQNELFVGEFQLLYPSCSILAEPVVALLAPHLQRRNTASMARDYLAGLYGDDGQALAGQMGFRPRSERFAAPGRFPPLRRFSVADSFGSWEAAMRMHFEGAQATFPFLITLRTARAGGSE